MIRFCPTAEGAGFSGMRGYEETKIRTITLCAHFATSFRHGREGISAQIPSVNSRTRKAGRLSIQSTLALATNQ